MKFAVVRLAVANCHEAGAVDKQSTYIRRLRWFVVLVDQVELVHVVAGLVEYVDLA